MAAIITLAISRVMCDILHIDKLQRSLELFVQLELAEDCLLNGMDLSGLLLLYSSIGDAQGILKLSSLAKEQGKSNVAFLCLFTLGKLEECIQLLLERYPFSSLLY